MGSVIIDMQGICSSRSECVNLRLKRVSYLCIGGPLHKRWDKRFILLTANL